MLLPTRPTRKPCALSLSTWEQEPKSLLELGKGCLRFGGNSLVTSPPRPMWVWRPTILVLRDHRSRAKGVHCATTQAPLDVSWEKEKQPIGGWADIAQGVSGFALHTAEPGLIPGIPGPPSLPEWFLSEDSSNPEHQQVWPPPKQKVYRYGLRACHGLLLRRQSWQLWSTYPAIVA